MDNLVIIGASGHARVVAAAARQSGMFVLGLIDNARLKGEDVDGLPILGGDEVLPRLLGTVDNLCVIVGVGNNTLRRSICQRIEGWKFATVIHPSAIIAPGVEIGGGTFIAASATINSGAIIGQHVIVNTNSSVDHDCQVGDFAAVSPGSILTGGVLIGAGAMIGAGAVIIPGVEIGENAIVGAGASVVGSVPSNTTYVGVPARPTPKFIQN